MIANAMLFGFTLLALALPVFGLALGKLPGPRGHAIARREDSPAWFWIYFSTYAAIAAAFIVALAGRLSGLIR